MKIWIVLLTVLLAGCGTGKESAESAMEEGSAARGISAMSAENPELLREKVMSLIGEGREAGAALEIIQRYEADLGFVADGDFSGARVRRFVRNSLAVAMIGVNECYENFNETGEDRFARRGLAHGYIALISNPSPSQRSDVMSKMKILQAPFLK